MFQRRGFLGRAVVAVAAMLGFRPKVNAEHPTMPDEAFFGEWAIYRYERSPDHIPFVLAGKLKGSYPLAIKNVVGEGKEIVFKEDDWIFFDIDKDGKFSLCFRWSPKGLADHLNQSLHPNFLNSDLKLWRLESNLTGKLKKMLAGKPADRIHYSDVCMATTGIRGMVCDVVKMFIKHRWEMNRYCSQQLPIEPNVVYITPEMEKALELHNRYEGHLQPGENLRKNFKMLFGMRIVWDASCFEVAYEPSSLDGKG
jgi:hypothetical protein